MKPDYYNYVKSLDNYLRASNKYIDAMSKSIVTWNTRLDNIGELLDNVGALLYSYNENFLPDLEELANYDKNVEDYAWFDQLSDAEVTEAYAKYDEVQELRSELHDIVDEITKLTKFLNSFNI